MKMLVLVVSAAGIPSQVRCSVVAPVAIGMARLHAIRLDEDESLKNYSMDQKLLLLVLAGKTYYPIAISLDCLRKNTTRKCVHGIS
ncbi:MAG: hypothetical protein A2486_07250 [Burkholderiales bacterium RIFOXYC12_FULL_65_23]|nr:MAG: hypothetical protein A2486_07250 [Burkholderiales bacterium RIFOXYC12_FULL_65_23]